MNESEFSPLHALPSGLCEDLSGEAIALLRRMAKADGSALATLHGMWCPALLGIACRILGDRREAEDVVQETFVRIWHRAAEYDPHQSPPFVWAFAVMRGFCIDRLRHRHRSRHDTPPAHQTAAETSEDPRVMALDDCQRLRAAMDQLDPDERASLELAVFLGYAHPEQSEAPGASLGTIKARLRRALEKTRHQLSRYEL